MPTVNDAARITTRDGSVWRTCAGCGLLSALPPNADKCPVCDRPTTATTDVRPAPDIWEIAHRYAAALGRVEAWAVLIPHVTDAERLAKIREALTGLNLDRNGGQQ